MKCPMCMNEIQENATQCSFCGCKIVYNGRVSDNTEPIHMVNQSSKNGSFKKILYVALPVIVVGVFIAAIIFNGNSYNNKHVEPNYNNYEYYDEGDIDVNGWMQDNAEGKDYNYDDGGSYYCMGKNDTCPNKTNNAYDLFCSSCDPDGDNREG